MTKMAEQKEEITALPWRVNPYSTHIDSASVSGAICKFESKHGFYDNHVANAAYIVLACNAYPSLLKENEELRKALDRALGHIDHMAAFFGDQNMKLGLGYSFEALGEDIGDLRAAKKERM